MDNVSVSQVLIAGFVCEGDNLCVELDDALLLIPEWSATFN